MALKDMIEHWSLGVEHAEAGNFHDALDVLTEIPEPGARIYFNIASVFLRLGNLEDAQRNLDLAVKKDPHFALAYFQRGCLQLQKKNLKEALEDFDTSMKTLRQNLLIDYKQLGLQYKLYSCEVMYNRAYAYVEHGQTGRAVEELEAAKKGAAQTSESRHKIINAALESIRAGQSFLPYRLPKNAILFSPPRSKTQVLNPVNFMGKAKVLSSIVDQDDYTGFVGVQEEKLRSRSPSPSPYGGRSPGRHRRSPSPARHTSGGPVRPTGRAPRVPKPDIPPPLPNMKMSSRKASLPTKHVVPLILPKRDSSASLIVKSRPPKPDIAPPPSVSSGTKGSPPSSKHLTSKPPIRPVKSHELTPSGRSRSPLSGRSPSPTESMITVKVHYTTTRALRVNADVSFSQLTKKVCKKFGQADCTLELWYKNASGELTELSSDSDLKQAALTLEDGFRLTLWAYDNTDHKAEVLKEVLALFDYEAQFDDELNFSSGDTIQIIAEVNVDWYRGTCHGSEGILPKSFVKDS